MKVAYYFFHLGKMLKTDGTKKYFLPQKRIFLFNYIFYQENCSTWVYSLKSYRFPANHQYFPISLWRMYKHCLRIQFISNKYSVFYSKHIKQIWKLISSIIIGQRWHNCQWNLEFWAHTHNYYLIYFPKQAFETLQHRRDTCEAIYWVIITG